MKYLTPQLYVELNKSTDTQVEQVYERWEAAGAAARARFAVIRDRLPPEFVQLFENRCLHDAEVLSVNVSGHEDGVGTLVAVINVRQGHDVIALVYDLLQNPQRTIPFPSDVFSAESSRVSWLYDEIDLLSDSEFRHEILLNTGEVLELNFFQFGMFIYHSAHAVVSSVG